MTNKSGEYQDNRRQIDWSQQLMIRGYESMAASLESLLVDDQPLVDWLTTTWQNQLTQSGSSYENTMRLFFSREASLYDLVHSPFITAFMHNKQCKPEENTLLTRLRSKATFNDQETEEFFSFIESRIAFFASSFKYLILRDFLIPRLDASALRERRVDVLKRLWRDDPEKARRIQQNATMSRTFEPRVFTEPVRLAIQKCFDSGLSYAETVEAIKREMGIELSAGSLKEAVRSYPDLNYDSVIATRQQERDDVTALVLQTFEATNGSRIEMYRILGEKNILPNTIDTILYENRKRLRLDWRELIRINNINTTLEQALQDHAKNVFTNIIEEYEAFLQLLRQNNLEDVIKKLSYSSYRTKRRYVLKNG